MSTPPLISWVAFVSLDISAITELLFVRAAGGQSGWWLSGWGLIAAPTLDTARVTISIHWCYLACFRISDSTKGDASSRKCSPTHGEHLIYITIMIKSIFILHIVIGSSCSHFSASSEAFLTSKKEGFQRDCELEVWLHGRLLGVTLEGWAVRKDLSSYKVCAFAGWVGVKVTDGKHCLEKLSLTDNGNFRNFRGKVVVPRR